MPSDRARGVRFCSPLRSGRRRPGCRRRRGKRARTACCRSRRSPRASPTSRRRSSPAEAAALETKLADWEARTSNQLVVLMVPTTQPEPIEAYSLRVAEKWKIGRKGQDNGALFLIAKNDRKMRIEVGYGLEGVLPDVTANRIIREDVAPAFREGKFAAGINAGVDRIIAVVGGENASAAARRRDKAKRTRRRIRLRADPVRPVLRRPGRRRACCAGSSAGSADRRSAAASSAPSSGFSPARSCSASSRAVVGFIVMLAIGHGRRHWRVAAAGGRRPAAAGAAAASGRRVLAAAADSRAAAAASAAAARRETGERGSDDMSRPTRFAASSAISRPTARQRAARVSRRPSLARIEAAIAEGEKRHRGQVRFAVEPALPLARVLRGVTAARARARGVRRCCGSGIPRRTAASSSICCSPTATSRSSPIAAFTRSVGNAAWDGRLPEDGNGVSRRPLRRRRRGRASPRSTRCSPQHYPRDGTRRGNELPDRPVVL